MCWSALQELSSYGDRRGVEIFPEINIVSGAGGWFAGGFVCPCPNHACSTGHGIPVNLTNTFRMAVVSNVIQIEESHYHFNSPFLHLGYDEREESRPCLQEGGITVDYDSVEQKLMALMSVLEIPSRHVVRWESSDTEYSSSRKRAGLVTHYHLTEPQEDEPNPFFVTTGLRFDDLSNFNDTAWDIYHKTRDYSQQENVLGIFAGTMEVSPQMWSALNIDGRLIAMAIGASTKARNDLTEEEFRKLYRIACNEMDFSHQMCNLYGKPRLSADYWKTERNQQRTLRLNTTCDRMTEWSETRKMKTQVVGKLKSPHFGENIVCLNVTNKL